ncbi:MULTISPECIES: N-acetylneuraminate synthase family protein [unclassified Treponema]|uniref:N-acetylneuraminate synthase family protein n=1 Tax=unclassified Treponema TaxID=2638727 RepID=UPI0020A481EE|nr:MULTISPECIES: N-acetylneuraminate synthase family protein [unclassified Treponema]UTC66227.1 N-acetylneuraminate synthase family protein [Treponema sp. OMZ 789]UTC68956.1 N-acetylneuraminate synthase family protein [Treponema sp. OMZ 790]UTC71683.1 N-acetylneuraminate synthase family protein [Treponema sp. OMZ 791]
MYNKCEEFKLGSEIFSVKNPLTIAEIGTSHNGSIKAAEALIDAAAEAGARAVKFQIVYADEILHPNTGYVDLPTGKIPLYERFKSLEVSIEFYKELAEYSRSKKLLFSASPFGFRSAAELAALKPDFIKIASPELNYVQLLKHCAKFNFSMILSSGVSLLKDIEKALNFLHSENKELQTALLHCITSYPAPEKEYNVSVIKNLSRIFGIACGVSDHSLDPILVPALTLASGGFIIEKHICLSRNEKGLDDPVALEPEMFKKMCSFLNSFSGKTYDEIIEGLIKLNYSAELINEVLGSGEKKLSPAESRNYGRTNRSIHYLHDLKKGDVITDKDIAVLRTEKVLSPGVEPEMFDSFIGVVLQRPVTAGEGLLMQDFLIRK